MTNEETEIKNGILLELGSRPDIRLFNNPVGMGVSGKITNLGGGSFRVDHGHVVRYGLMPGSADLIGIKRVKVTQDMVGKEVGLFFSCEVKTKAGVARKNQKKWADFITTFGGCTVICRGIKQAMSL